MQPRRSRLLLPALALAGVAVEAATICFSGGTIIAYDEGSGNLDVVRNGSLVVVDDRISAINSDPACAEANGTEVVDVTGKILTPGFVDTHRHGWQTAFKTLASNTTLWEYFLRYGEYASAGTYTAEDVYLGQLAGLYESLNAGVTTTLDHAHHTWSDETSEAGLRASVDSRARVFWAYAFHSVANYTVPEQLANFRALAASGIIDGSPTSLGVAYDAFGPTPNPAEIQAVGDLAKEYNVSVITTHSVSGVFGFSNTPTEVNNFGLLNISIPVVFSHASFISPNDVALLRSTNQFASITPESELHYGHTHPWSHLFQDQGALGVDTHATFSTDILTQARIWLQKTRWLLYTEIIDRFQVPATNPMSVNQAFLLATRNGGLALRRPDLGVIAVGAKADLVVWDGTSPALLGWRDPVAAVILHASVGDIESVLVDGAFVKRDRRLVVGDYADVQARFLESAKRIQDNLINTPLPVPEGNWGANLPLASTLRVDVSQGAGDGYGPLFL